MRGRCTRHHIVKSPPRVTRREIARSNRVRRGRSWTPRSAPMKASSSSTREAQIAEEPWNLHRPTDQQRLQGLEMTDRKAASVENPSTTLRRAPPSDFVRVARLHRHSA